LRTDPRITKRLIDKYPKQWQDFKDGIKVIKITCQESKVASVAAELRDLGLENAEDYIRAVSERSHGAAFDIIVDASNDYLRHAAKLFFLTLNYFNQETEEAQIKNRYVFNRLISEGKLPRLNSEREASAAA
jgi:hypothetical protein